MPWESPHTASALMMGSYLQSLWALVSWPLVKDGEHAPVEAAPVDSSPTAEDSSSVRIAVARLGGECSAEPE